MSYLRIKKAVLLLGNECEIIEDRVENREKDEHIVSKTQDHNVIIVQCNNS